jgi:AraC family transcriptional regulator of arabinose operon
LESSRRRSPFWRFYYNPKPGCHLVFRGQHIPLEPKNAVLIPADTVFDCVGPVRACHYWLHFTTNHPGVSFSAKPMLFPVDDRMRSLLSQLIEIHQGSSEGHRLLHLASALLHIVFGKLDSPAQILPERLSEVLALGTRIRLAGEALALTDKTIDQIAVETGFPNRHYLSRMFARQVGCGPAEYRARQRERKGR